LEEKISRYARVPHYVLIVGERGTGKTTIARRLHEQSERAKKEFINLNCASLTPELLESELFGYEKGAFTGATAPKAGLFESAGGGTLFLNEIGEIPLALQRKLLKAVEEKRIRRVGSNLERAVDMRIVAATSQDLKQMIEKGSFRANLFDRLNILTLETSRFVSRRGHVCLPLQTVDFRGSAAKDYSQLKLDCFIARTLIMPLAKWYDPNLPQIIRMLDMCSDRDVAAAAFRTAFFRQIQSGSAHPVSQPRLIFIQTFTLTTGSPIRIVYDIAHCVTPIFFSFMKF
jgi:hypothetical protein